LYSNKTNVLYAFILNITSQYPSDLDSHCIHGSLEPNESVPKMAFTAGACVVYVRLV